MIAKGDCKEFTFPGNTFRFPCKRIVKMEQGRVGLSPRNCLQIRERKGENFRSTNVRFRLPTLTGLTKVVEAFN